ncbi:hypothetical protein V1478_002432 [Vespula squamosa]|uniref:Uncharacterized protein n=1 Tax=Vespula squamosa TaxID=30214 RepID=A0ABD2BPR5_VESSQ
MTILGNADNSALKLLQLVCKENIASVRYDTLTWRAYIKLHGNGQRYYTIEEYQRLPVLFWCLSGIL